jgi:hypothetical protein
MSQRTEIFLPTEIIIRIVTFVDAADGSQQCLHACCLVSRQWYSASVALLYAEPDFQHAFEKFTATVCPPIATSKSKTDPGLGSLVRVLDMSPLVHHSTNSVTARLLGRVKKNLEVFIAPMISFSWVQLVIFICAVSATFFWCYQTMYSYTCRQIIYVSLNL